MLMAIGILAIDNADGPQQPSGFAGAVTQPGSTLAPAAASATAASRPAARRLTPQPANSLAAAPNTATPTLAGRPTSQTIHARQSAGSTDYAQAVFLAVNRGRTAQHLPALLWDARLQQSARAHNRAMANSNTLSHQIDAEPSLGSRESAAGMQWTYAAENIGWTTERSLAGVLDIEARMLTENPPNDAHRRNILSRQAQSLGVDVYYDAVHGRLWLTEDFSGKN
jgi:uncharacterized protein YkwD